MPTKKTTQPTESSPIQIVPLALNSIRVGKNPRSASLMGDIEGLAESIKQVGLLVPLVVRPVSGGHELIAGGRRYAAAVLAGLESVACRVIEADDCAALEIALTENLQRLDVSPLDEAQSFAELKELGRTDEQIGERLGRSASYVRERRRLLELIPELRELLADGRISPGVAVLVARLPQREQKSMRRKIEDLGDKALTVKGAANEIRWLALHLSNAPFSPEDAELVPEAGACSTCPFNTAVGWALAFEEHQLAVDARCTNGACWESKIKAQIAKARAELEAKTGAVPIGAVIGRKAKGNQVEADDTMISAHPFEGSVPAIIEAAPAHSQFDVGQAVFIPDPTGPNAKKDSTQRKQEERERELEQEREERERQVVQADRACKALADHPNRLQILTHVLLTQRLDAWLVGYQPELEAWQKSHEAQIAAVQAVGSSVEQVAEVLFEIATQLVGDAFQSAKDGHYFPPGHPVSLFGGLAEELLRIEPEESATPVETEQEQKPPVEHHKVELATIEDGEPEPVPAKPKRKPTAPNGRLLLPLGKAKPEPERCEAQTSAASLPDRFESDGVAFSVTWKEAAVGWYLTVVRLGAVGSKHIGARVTLVPKGRLEKDGVEAVLAVACRPLMIEEAKHHGV